MSNASIAQRILQTIAAYERGEVGSTSVADSIELHEPAFEDLKRDIRNHIHRLSLEIVKQDISPLEEEMLGWKASRSALEELKSVLNKIATSSSADNS